MPDAIRAPITNTCKDGQFAAPIRVGPHRQALNVLLDTGSGPLVLDAAKYAPDIAGGDVTTRQAQSVAYADGSGWTAAVIETSLCIGEGAGARVSAAIAYQTSEGVFGAADGVMGLAYAPLDTGFALPADTWATKYPATAVAAGKPANLTPCLDQLSRAGVAVDEVSFLVRRSMIRAGPDPAADPLNGGWMVLGDGEGCADLYTGPFTVVRVVADAWCNTHLKEVIVGNASPIRAPPKGPAPSPSNSAVDTGNPTLVLAPLMLQQVLAKFTAGQQALLTASLAGRPVAAADLDLSGWPDIDLLLEGEAGADVRLSVGPSSYWQVDAPAPGQAKAAISAGIPDITILGLPVMSGRFTIFNRTPGQGTIKFAAAR